MAPLRRPAICQLIGFNSWTAVQVWLDEVVGLAWAELKTDYLRHFGELGIRHPPGTEVTKDIIIQSGDALDVMVEMCERQMMEGTLHGLRKTQCE